MARIAHGLELLKKGMIRHIGNTLRSESGVIGEFPENHLTRSSPRKEDVDYTGSLSCMIWMGHGMLILVVITS